MAMILNFEDLESWKSARALCNVMLDVTSRTEFYYAFRLKDQIAGAAISVMNNIAEGFSRKSDKEFVRFLDIAIASAGELKSMTYLLLDRGLIKNNEFDSIIKSINQTIGLMRGMIKYLQSK
jgi:four helix bundle protein